MKNHMLRVLTLAGVSAFTLGALLFAHPTQVLSIAQAKVNICHQKGNGDYEAIRVNDDGHWNGHDDHEGDFLYQGPTDDGKPTHDGDEWCEDNASTPTPTPTPTPVQCDPEEEECVTPTPTPTPEQTQSSTNTGGPGDGLSDGRSDGRSSCPECTKAPSGQVLGASTDFAGTGTTVDMLMNAVGALGGLSTASGLAMIAKKKFNK